MKGEKDQSQQQSLVNRVWSSIPSIRQRKKTVTGQDTQTDTQASYAVITDNNIKKKGDFILDSDSEEKLTEETKPKTVKKEFRCLPCPGWYEVKGKHTANIVKQAQEKQQGGSRSCNIL